MDVPDIVYFFCAGRGEGSPRPREGGERSFFFVENPRREGGGFEDGRGRGPGRCLRRIWGGGGLNFFFSGPKCPPSSRDCRHSGDPFSDKTRLQ